MVLGSQGYTRGFLPPGNPRAPRAGGRSRAERDLSRGQPTELLAHTDLSLVPLNFLFKHLCGSWALCLLQPPGCTGIYYVRPGVPLPWGGGMQARVFPRGSLEEGDLE